VVGKLVRLNTWCSEELVVDLAADVEARFFKIHLMKQIRQRTTATIRIAANVEQIGTMDSVCGEQKEFLRKAGAHGDPAPPPSPQTTSCST
jgi:transposase